MEKNQSSSIRRSNKTGIEENTLAIIDHTEYKDSQDASNDRVAFLEAVRASSIVPENGAPPTNKMYGAVFQILRGGKSLELIMASYQLLHELDKHFPRVIVSKSSPDNLPRLAVVDEAWSPFILTDLASSDKESSGLDFMGFHGLIQDLAMVFSETNAKTLEAKSLGNMLLLQYLVSVLDGDFLPRNHMYKETKNWAFLRQSLLNMLLGSRRINYKVLMKDCLSILCGAFGEMSNDLKGPENSVPKASDNSDTAVAMALVDIAKRTCTAVKKFLIVVMELDVSRKEAEMEGCTTRADGVRTPLVEMILDELTYNQDILSPFLQVFNEPKWKLEIVLQYFLKYTAKPSTRTRRSAGSNNDATFSGVLKSFSNGNSIRSITKKVGTEVVQLLLAHAFQTHLAVSSQHAEDIPDSNEASRGNSLLEICKNIISAFKSLRATDGDMEILPLGKEALFTAATLLSTTS